MRGVFIQDRLFSVTSNVGLSLQIVTIDSVLNWLKDIVPFYNINTDAIAIAKSSSHIEIFAVGIQSTSAVQAAIFGILSNSLSLLGDTNQKNIGNLLVPVIGENPRCQQQLYRSSLACPKKLKYVHEVMS